MTTTAQSPVARTPSSELSAAQLAVSQSAVPGLDVCLDLAKVYEREGNLASAQQWAFAATDAGDDFAGWLKAARVVKRSRLELPAAARSARVAVLGSYTTSQFVSLLPLAAARAGLDVDVYESGYGQYRLDVLDPGSGLHEFAPDVVVLAVHEAEVQLPVQSAEPEAAVEAELTRWTSLWEQIGQLGARVIQHNFAIPPEVSLGHLAARTPGSRYAMLHRLNERLGEAAGDRVSVVDCERLSSTVGKNSWFDARYFHLAKQAVGLNSVPVLARHTAAVMAGDVGLAKKCLVLDLDNTLWGGVLGEVGVSGIAIGTGAVGEAFSAFQRYVLELKEKGVILAVCSKNNDFDVREAFANHPDMLVRLDDLAVMLASWEDKPTAIRRIASILGIGLDSLVFVDDNPAEREAVRELLPEVDVIPLPEDPAHYVRAVSNYPFFETPALTADDAARTEQYQARAGAATLQASAKTLEDFLGGLDMHASFAAISDVNTARVAQLIGKTNQFNVTSRRRTEAQVEQLSRDPSWLSQVVRLRDRFADHGIIGVLLAQYRGEHLEVDTWLLSCRVIGRTVENEMMRQLIADAERLGCTTVSGSYLPTAKNAQVADLFARYGFAASPADVQTAETRWTLQLPAAALPPALMSVDLSDSPHRSALPRPEIAKVMK